MMTDRNARLPLKRHDAASAAKPRLAPRHAGVTRRSLLAIVTRADLDAIYAYLRTLPAVKNRVNRSTLPFPFSIRLSMSGWNALFFTPQSVVSDPKRSAEFNRGAYLVEGLGHCGACHTPMNAAGAARADRYLQGSQLDNWTAPDITDDRRAGLGNWSVDGIVQYLKAGQTPRPRQRHRR